MIRVRRAHTAYLRVRVEPGGVVSATIPYYATLIALRALIEKNRRSLRRSIARMPAVRHFDEAQIRQIRRKAKDFLPRRLEFLAAQRGFKYGRVSLRNQKTRWGSCSADNNISLNISLVLLPPHLIDYVLLHELTHTVHKNHGTDFWAKLTAVCPDAKKYRRELRDHNSHLVQM